MGVIYGRGIWGGWGSGPMGGASFFQGGGAGGYLDRNHHFAVLTIPPPPDLRLLPYIALWPRAFNHGPVGPPQQHLWSYGVSSKDSPFPNTSLSQSQFFENCFLFYLLASSSARPAGFHQQPKLYQVPSSLCFSELCLSFSRCPRWSRSVPPRWSMRLRRERGPSSR